MAARSARKASTIIGSAATAEPNASAIISAGTAGAPSLALTRRIIASAKLARLRMAPTSKGASAGSRASAALASSRICRHIALLAHISVRAARPPPSGNIEQPAGSFFTRSRLSPSIDRRLRTKKAGANC